MPSFYFHYNSINRYVASFARFPDGALLLPFIPPVMSHATDSDVLIIDVGPVGSRTGAIPAEYERGAQKASA